MSTVPTITLNDGKSIPQLGFGVFQIELAGYGESSRVASMWDTATSTLPRCTKQNEKQVGQGVRASGLDRSEGTRDGAS